MSAIKLEKDIQMLLRQSDQEQEIEKIKLVLEDYFDGAKTGDSTLIKKAFHANARLKHIKTDQSIFESNLDHFVNFLDENGAMPIDRTEILGVDVFETAAKAKVIFILSDFIYVDFLNLLRIDGSWKIVDKVYVRKDF